MTLQEHIKELRRAINFTGVQCWADLTTDNLFIHNGVRGFAITRKCLESWPIERIAAQTANALSALREGLDRSSDGVKIEPVPPYAKGWQEKTTHMTLDEMCRDFESRFTVYPHCGNRTLAPTGEPYVVVTGGPYDSEAACLAGLQALLVKYAQDKAGTLYWRVRPEVERDFRLMKWRCHARLLISDKRVAVLPTQSLKIHLRHNQITDSGRK